MNEEQFKQNLAAVTKKAQAQGFCISKEELYEAFPDIKENDARMGLLLDYFKERKISVGDKAEVEEYLSLADKSYLDEYLAGLGQTEELEKAQMAEVLRAAAAGDGGAVQTTLAQFLPKVVSLAKLYAGQGVLLEDLIGEGNLALAEGVTQLGCLDVDAEDICEEADGFLGRLMMDGMERLINGELSEKDMDERVISKINKIADAAAQLSEDLRRKVSPEELCANTDFTLDEVADALRISGNRIESIEG